MNLLVIFTRRHVCEFRRTGGDTLGPCYERLGIEGPLHVVAILAARAAILRLVTLG